MARRPSRDEAEAILRELVVGRWRGRGDVAAALRAELDQSLVADAARALLPRTWFFARACRALPPAAARLVLEGPRPSSDDSGVVDATLVFLKEAVPIALDDEALARAWDEALGALLDANTSYAWGSKQRRAKIRGLATSRFLPAIQAVAAGCTKVPADLLAVLVADGSEASADALLPHFHRAATSDRGHGLDLLERLRTHAADTPPIRALLDEVERLLGVREAASPALAVARAIGLGDLDSFWFWAFLGATQTNRNRVPSVQSNLSIDSTSPTWFSVSISVVDPGDVDRRSLSFSNDAVHRDDFGLGPCEAAALPSLLARAAQLLSITWNFADIGLRTSLRGKRRERLLAWLASGTAT